MVANEGTLFRLAEAVADGMDVDWDHAESGAASSEEERVVRGLRRLADVGAAARSQASVWGPLQIRGEVGGGSFGTVYRAWDTRLEREVALKLLTHDAPLHPAASVIREARLLAQIRHPNVVIVHGADVFAGRVGIWMDFITGRTLKELLEAQGPFGAHEAALIGRDLCRALAAVHQKGFVHRDIKAQNVMREAGGRTVLMDFGAGVDAGGDDVAPLAGSPAYLAPEVLSGEPASARSDLYALGVLLFHLVSGSFPVTGASLADIRERHATGIRGRLRDLRPDLPSAFTKVVDRLIAADPRERPESAGAAEGLLDTALTSDGAETVAVRPSSRAASVWTRQTAAVLAVVVVLAVTAFAGWPLTRTGPTASAARNSVAILPFKNLTPGESDNDYFTAGVTDDVAAALAKLTNLKVVSAASYGGSRDNIHEVATALGVATVLSGSIRREGDQIRLVGQLLDGSTGEQLWSESYERRIEDVFALQSEFSRKIAAALRGELTEDDAQRLAARGARTFDAYNFYVKGRYYSSLRTEEGFLKSLDAFQAALKEDPSYALPYAGLADTYTLQGVYGFTPRSRALLLADDAAQRALVLDESLAEAHASRGYIQKNRFEWLAAEASFKRALALKPGYANAHVWYGIYLTQQGRFDEAIAELKTALALDPLSLNTNWQFAATLLLARRYDDAIAQTKRTAEIDPSHRTLHQILGEAYAFKRDFVPALDEIQQALQLSPIGSDDQELQGNLGYILAASGQRPKAIALIRDLEARERAGQPVAAAIACIYAALGRSNEAIDYLNKARARGLSELGYLKVDPRWDSLRDDPRFQELLRLVGFPQ